MDKIETLDTKYQPNYDFTNTREITVEDLETRISNFIENAKISLTGTQFNFISNLKSTQLQPFSSRDE